MCASQLVGFEEPSSSLYLQHCRLRTGLLRIELTNTPYSLMLSSQISDIQDADHLPEIQLSLSQSEASVVGRGFSALARLTVQVTPS